MGILAAIAGLFDESRNDHRYISPGILDIDQVRRISFVHRGMSLLDSVNPGWEDMVDLGKINLLSEKDCILGQVYGDFAAGLGVLMKSMDLQATTGDDLTTTMSYGFMVDRLVTGIRQENDVLSRTWRAAIRKRLRENEEKEA